jgi:hypothetical protein
MRASHGYTAIPNMDTPADHTKNGKAPPQYTAEPAEQQPVVDGDSKNASANLTVLDNAAAIPKGTIDPVYEAKAKVLNNAVCFMSH